MASNYSKSSYEIYDQNIDKCSCNEFFHNKNQYLTFFKNKKFYIFQKIKKFKADPIPEFINIVENNNFSFLMNLLKKVKRKEDIQYVVTIQLKQYK